MNAPSNLCVCVFSETEKTPEESEKEKLNGEETVANQEKSMQTVVDTVEPRMPAWKMLCKLI
jgi:hypothetical protein